MAVSAYTGQSAKSPATRLVAGLFAGAAWARAGVQQPLRDGKPGRAGGSGLGGQGGAVGSDASLHLVEQGHLDGNLLGIDVSQQAVGAGGLAVALLQLLALHHVALALVGEVGLGGGVEAGLGEAVVERGDFAVHLAQLGGGVVFGAAGAVVGQVEVGIAGSEGFQLEVEFLGSGVALGAGSQDGIVNCHDVRKFKNCGTRVVCAAI